MEDLLVIFNPQNFETYFFACKKKIMSLTFVNEEDPEKRHA